MRERQRMHFFKLVLDNALLYGPSLNSPSLMKPQVLVLLALAIAAPPLHGSTPAWPAFRGPNCSGVAIDATPPINIGPTNSVLWKIQVPWSPSSPCIWKDRIFLTTFADNELQTRCYQQKDGKLAWSRGIKAQTLEMFHS